MLRNTNEPFQRRVLSHSIQSCYEFIIIHTFTSTRVEISITNWDPRLPIKSFISRTSLRDNKARGARVLLVDRRASVQGRKVDLVPYFGTGKALLNINKNESVIIPRLDGTERPGDGRVVASKERNIWKSICGGERGIAARPFVHLVGGHVEVEAEVEDLLVSRLNTFFRLQFVPTGTKPCCCGNKNIHEVFW